MGSGHTKVGDYTSVGTVSILYDGNPREVLFTADQNHSVKIVGSTAAVFIPNPPPDRAEIGSALVVMPSSGERLVRLAVSGVTEFIRKLGRASISGSTVELRVERDGANGLRVVGGTVPAPKRG